MLYIFEAYEIADNSRNELHSLSRAWNPIELTVHEADDSARSASSSRSIG